MDVALITVRRETMIKNREEKDVISPAAQADGSLMRSDEDRKMTDYR